MAFLHIFYSLLLSSANSVTITCNSKIYCEGKFFEYMVQTDSFLYKAMLYPESTVLNNFEELLQNTSNRPTYQELIDFRDKHFVDEGVGIMVLKDYYASSTFVEKILSRSRLVGDVTRSLISSWNDFLVNGTESGVLPKEQYSLISPHEFINTNTELETECSYWDHYWIVNGMVASNMYNTAQTLIHNLISMVKTYRMVPAGNRMFYVGRSNPPLLTPIVYSFFMATNRYNWLLQNILYLDQELQFWIKHRSVKLNIDNKNYTLYRYNSNIDKPRPEMYKLDTAFVESLLNRREIYKELNTLTETGDGISERWIYRPINTTANHMSFLQPSQVLPVDLNSFIYKSFTCLAQLYTITNNKTRQIYWNNRAQMLLNAISRILWNNTENMWYDYHLKTRTHRRVLTISNFMPIWAQAFDKRDASEKIEMALSRLQNYSILDKLHVQIPISATKRRFVWSYSTSVPKLEAMVMEGLANLLEHNSQIYFNITMANMLRSITAKYVEIKEMIQRDNYANVLYVDRSKSPVIGSYVKLVKDYYNIVVERNIACEVRFSITAICALVIYFMLI